MKTIIIKSKNNFDEDCKTYIIEMKNSIIFKRLTLCKVEEKSPFFYDMLIKKNKKYALYQISFGIKKSTLLPALEKLDLIKILDLH